MVRIFSKFRQTAVDAREELHWSSNQISESRVLEYDNEVTVAFNPIQHPTEPLDNDQPVQCPFPQPSLLMDGRTWNERASKGVHKRAKTPVEAEDARRTKHRAPTRGITNEHGINFNT